MSPAAATGAADHLVQRQHRVVAGMIGVVAGRPVDDLAVLAQGEIVGDRDRLVVGDEKAVLRPGGRRPRAHPRAGAGLQQIDRRLAAERVGAAAGRHPGFSWVPQPSSAGCMPSDTKPSTDQVLTNISARLGVARALGVALGDVDALDADAPHQAAPTPRGSSARPPVTPRSRGDVEQRLLDEPGHHAGIGAAAADRGDAAGIAPAQLEQALAQRVVGARPTGDRARSE